MSLILAGAAQADTPPTQRQLNTAVQIAATYWHGNPSCGRPDIALGDLPDMTAMAFPSCQIIIDTSQRDWTDTSSLLCVVMVHEWGHLVLGENYFAATNPTDPSHSPDSRNVMYHQTYDPALVPACNAIDHPARLTRAREHPRHHHARKRLRAKCCAAVAPCECPRRYSRPVRLTQHSPMRSTQPPGR